MVQCPEHGEEEEEPKAAQEKKEVEIREEVSSLVRLDLTVF